MINRVKFTDGEIHLIYGKEGDIDLSIVDLGDNIPDGFIFLDEEECLVLADALVEVVAAKRKL